MRSVLPITATELRGDLTGTVLVVAAYATPHGSETGRGGGVVAETFGFGPEVMHPVDAGFRAESGQSCRMVLTGDATRTTVLLVGLGARSEVSADVVRAAAQQSAQQLHSIPVVSTLALELDDLPAAIRAVAEGTILGDFSFRRDDAVTDPLDASSAEARILIPADLEAGVAAASLSVGRVYAESTNWVRQLVEMPSNHLGPAELAAAIVARVKELAADALDVSVWSVEELAQRGFGATLAVGAGSDRPPCVVELRSRSSGPMLGIAGKGITFDSGGINIKKDAAELAWMKSDMAGAASVAAAVIAAASLSECPAIHAILPIADNMPAGNALRPGDVVVHPNGRTTEVVDTDCEGRLVLADAIAWLSGTNPIAIIDVGTLTDSGGVGTALWGCWANDPDFAANLTKAGLAAGDPGWILPLHPSYRSMFTSAVADSRNAAADVPDSGQLAATYLEPFAGGHPWAHIDNGSGAYLERDTGVWKQGPTGTPTRALIEYLRQSSGGYRKS